MSGKNTDFKVSRPANDRIPRPKSIKELPEYLIKRMKGFTARLLYIIGLVWEASPRILIAMCLLCVLDGVLPVVGAYISKYLINGIADLLVSSGVSSGSPVSLSFWARLRMLLMW